MPRPVKCRKICMIPENREFIPKNCSKINESIILSLDEYETIRLIDNEGLSQEKCAESMKIARTTVQLIYTMARKKLAKALVYGLALKIDGGNYFICDGSNIFCAHKACKRKCEKIQRGEKNENSHTS